MRAAFLCMEAAGSFETNETVGNYRLQAIQAVTVKSQFSAL